MATTTNEARLRLTAEDDTGRGMSSAARNMRRTADEAERQSRRVEAAVRRQQQTVERVGATLGGALGGAALAKTVKDSYVEFAGADRALSRIGNTAGKTSQEMQGVQRRLTAMADKFALPLNTVAEGLDSLVAGGRSLEDSLDFLPSVAAAAQASGANIQDMATSAGALGTAMGFTATQMTRAFDILVAGGQAGNFELKDMARYLPGLAPLAASVGYKGEEGLKKLVAILQVVRKQTGDAGQAADATREVFGKMNSEEINNAFKEFGNYDLKGRMQEWAKNGENLVSNFVGFTRDVLEANANGADPLLKLPTLFKDLQLQAGMRALLSSPGAVRELVKVLGNVDGTTVNNLKNVTEDAQAAADRLGNSWKGVERAIGEVLVAAHAPEGLQWLAARLKESAEGFKNIARLGFGGAVSRALNRDAVIGLSEDRDAKRKEVDEASTPGAKARLEGELREIEERLAVAVGRFQRADTLDKQTKDGLPGTPDLPGPLDPELTPGLQKPYVPPLDARPPSFKSMRDFDGAQLSPNSFGDETAQEDTQKGMARDITAIKNIWTRAVGPNAPSGRFGGLIQKASISTGPGEPDTGLQNGPGGAGGGGYSGSTGGGVGPRGGSGGMPNMRYGSGGRTPRAGGGGGGGEAGHDHGGGTGGSQGRSGESLPSAEGGGGVDQRQMAVASKRRQAITDGLRDQLAAAGKATGVNAEVFSGGQDETGPNRTGSHRHDNGQSADVKLYRRDQNGKRQYLSMDNEADRAVMEKFLATSVQAGANGIGAGPGYMGPNGMHIGGGSPLAWGAGGRAANAPEWVRRALAKGLEARRTNPITLPGGGGEQASGGGGGRQAGALTQRIEAEAKRAGIDPRLMHGIRAGESGHRADYDVKSDRAEDSYGPYQLNRRGGLGQEFEEQTGLSAKDPKTIGAQTRWVAEYIAKQRRRDPNWSPGKKWYGYKGLVNSDARWGESGYQPDKPAATADSGPAKAKAPEAPAIGSDGFGARGREPQAPQATPAQVERLRERPSTQARRETDREVRFARMNTYSDVGVA